MTETKPNKRKKEAKILLIILLLSIAWNLIEFYQTQYQLVSPLVPASTILMIVKPLIFTALISTIVCIAALILYFYEKYLPVIILCLLAIVTQQVYPYF